jgi:hypothetical protein
MSTDKIPPAEVAAGTKDEHAEHNMPLPIAKRTALDHLREFPHYYSDLAKAEPKFRKTALFATEALEQRKTAVFNDLAKHPNYVPGKDILADRAASASFIGHEKKHVLGIHNPLDVAFPDAAAHAGIADMVFRSRGQDIRELLPPAYHHLIRGTETYDTQGQSGTLKNRSYDLPTGRLATGWEPRNNLVATAHMRHDGSGRRIMIPNALADVARDHLSRHYSNDAVQQLSTIKAPIDLPPPRGFKPLNRSK